jgi:protein TonB
MSRLDAQARFKRQYRTALDVALGVSIVVHLFIFAICPQLPVPALAGPEPVAPVMYDLHEWDPTPPPPPSIQPPQIPPARLAEEYVAIVEPDAAPDEPLPPPEPITVARADPSSRFEAWDRPPRLLRTPFDPDRDYPPTAREAGLEGTVLLRVEVDERGRVTSVEVVRSDALMFDASAIRLVRGWEFDPAEQAGNPVSAVVLVPLSFRLGRDTVGQR